MKRFLFILAVLILCQSCSYAQSGISFVYINGSNNNDQKMKNWYENGVRKLHPYMKKAFEKDATTQKNLLKNGQYIVDEKPVIFFWGDKSHQDLTFVENNLKVSKGFSPFLAYEIRSALTHFLHDAIWIQKYHNMLPVLEDLHKSVMAEVNKGNKVVLYGYSAGSFITYEYLLTRLPIINVEDFYKNVEVPQSERDFVAQHPMKDTCMRAIGDELSVFSAAGHIVPNNDEQNFEKNYMDLDNLTDKYCVPDHAVKGIVNFASPLVLFYSDISDPNYQITYYNRLLFQYIVENDMFWLTVNYREDPLGFPGGRNLSLEELANVTNIRVSPNHTGFIYDQSDTRGGCPAFLAHTSYWSTRKTFSKAVVRAYDHGYKHYYDDNLKKRQVKKYIKTMDMMP